MTVKERFLNYVSYWTTSEEDVETFPSTKRQFELAKVLEQELKDLHLSKVKVDENCYVYGLLPATKGYESKKAIGFISHMDTAPDAPGKDVKPQIIENYDGNDIILPGTGEILSVKDFPDLKTLTGRTLITTDGTTLLGADDKAGIAEILTAMEEIINENIPHGDIWIAFTPDEEVGRGTDFFDLDYFKADYAYTLDGDYEGEVAYEIFNAAAAVFQITGVNVHPGSAKDIMVNAAAVACEIQGMLPEAETPWHTEDREGFYNLMHISGNIGSAELSYIVRDHDKTLFRERIDTLKSIEKKMNEKYHSDTVKLTVTDSYYNMLEVIEKHRYVVDIAEKAIQSIGLELVSNPVRGGTDGAQLSFKGLPCPNLGTGGYGFHGPFEHISVEGMENAIKIIKEIVKNPIDV